MGIVIASTQARQLFKSRGFTQGRPVSMRVMYQAYEFIFAKGDLKIHQSCEVLNMYTFRK